MADKPTVEAALLFMARRCDGAVQDDGIGFNGADTHFGHSLAERVANGGTLTIKQQRAALRMLRKYQGQLRQAGIEWSELSVPELDAPTAEGTRRLEAARADAPRLTVVADRIQAKTPFRLKDLCKEVPGARWNPQAKAWTYPAGPGSALALRDVFAPHGAVWDDGFALLVASAESQRAAAVHKERDDLPDVPICNLPAWNHQRQAFWFAKPQDAAVLDMEMGTGKSRVTVDLLQNNDARRVLIVCPPKVVGVWPREFRKHAAKGREWHVEDGRRAGRDGVLRIQGVADRVRMFEDALYECRCGKPHAVVVNYEATAHEPLKSWAPDGLDYVVFDEIHKIKASNGVWSKWCTRMGKRATRRLGLTGTLCPQSPLDVFAQYRALDPSIFGTSYTSFQRRYAVMGGYGGYEVLGLQREGELSEKISTIAYRVGAEVLDLPPIREVTRACEIGKEAQKVYKAVEGEMYAELDERIANDQTITAANVLVKMLRLQQITGGAVRTDEGVDVEIDTAKADLLADVLEEIGREDGRDPTSPFKPAVVFCRFIHDLDAVRRVAEATGRRYKEISGRSSEGLTQDATMAEDCDVVGVQIQSGGTGVDLTRAAHAIYYSLGFSLGDYLQSRRRVHRPGQTKSTLLVHLVAAGTIDEQVYEALAARQEVVDYVLGLAGRAQGLDKHSALEQAVGA